VAIEGECQTRGIIVGGSAIGLDMSFWPYGFTHQTGYTHTCWRRMHTRSKLLLIKDEKNHLQFLAPLPVCS